MIFLFIILWRFVFCWVSMVSQSSNGLNPSHGSTTWMHPQAARYNISFCFHHWIDMFSSILRKLWDEHFRYHESVAETMEPSFSSWISGRCLWRRSPRKTISYCWFGEILRENYQGCMKNNVKSGISTNLNWLDFGSPSTVLPSTVLANHCNNNWTEAVGRCKRWQVLPLYIGN